MPDSRKTLILGDLHLGCRNVNGFFMDLQRKFFRDVLFPKIKSENIREVVQLGDVLDNRSGVSFLTSKFLFEFLGWFEENNVKLYILAGNHDTFYKNTLDIVGIKQFEDMYRNIRVVTEPEIVHGNFLIVPWMCDENRESILGAIERCDPKSVAYLFGHFELSDFPVNRSVVAKEGQFEVEFVKKFRTVFSGHYHTPSEKGNIVYVGTPYGFTWNDHGDRKRFFVLDQETGETEEVLTGMNPFVSVIYDESLYDSDLSVYRDKIMKIVLTEDFDETKYDIFLQKLEQQGKPYKIQTIDARGKESLAQTIEENLDGITLEAPLDILSRTISGLDTTEDGKTFIQKEINEIYRITMEQNEKLL